MAAYFFRYVLTLLLIVSMHWVGFSQPEHLQFEHLPIEQGLSNHMVLNIQQDREGFMWFGTFSGLNKYDGYTFTIFTPDPKDPYRSLWDDHIFDIHEDREGRLWVATYGLHLLDKRTGKLTAYFTDSTRFTYQDVNCTVYEDKQGILWMSAGGGLNRFDPATKQFTSYPSPELVPNFGIVQDGNGTFWMGSQVGLYQFQVQTGRFIRFPLQSLTDRYPPITALRQDMEGILWIGTSKDGIFRLDPRVKPALAEPYHLQGQVKRSINRNAIFEDQRGQLWVGTTEGLQRINKDRTQVTTYQANRSLPGHLSSNNVLSVYEDKNGTLWVGTSNGIDKATPYSKPFSVHQITYTAQPIRLRENAIETILEDKEGMVWLGTGKGLYRFNPNDQKIAFFPLPSKDTRTRRFNLVNQSPGSEISIIHEDYLGRLWVGTKAGLYLWNPATHTFKHYPCKIPVYFMDEDPFGKLWIPGGDEASGRAVMAVFDLQQLVFQYTEYELDAPNGLKDMYLNGIMASRTGDIWVATQSWGLGRMDRKTGTFTHYLPHPEASNNNLFGRFIWYMYEDPDGLIWVGTKMSGLYRFDPKTGVFRSFTTHDGLPSNFVVSITGDGKGNLWIGTKNGLSRFNTQNNTFRNFDRREGLPINEFLIGSVFKGREKLLFGTDKGFIMFHPDSIRENTAVPPVYLTHLKVLEKSRPLPDSLLELPYQENFLSFEFVALHFQSPEKNQYAYQLVGLDKEWIYSGTRRYANYPGLAPGRYVFRVKASNNDGTWNEKGTSLVIIIHPPWWKTEWFYLTCAVILLAVLYSIYYIRVSRLKELLQVRNKIARDLHDDVGSTLSSITIMSEVAKQKVPQSAVWMDKIGVNAQQIQENMSDIIWSINPRNDRLEEVVQRMKLFAFEMLEAKGVRLQFSVDEILYDLKLSMNQRRTLYFIFKEAITNLTKYAACANAVAKITLHNRTLELVVQDDGKGFDTTVPTMGGNGFYNMEKRANEVKGTLKINSQKGKGTTVQLQFKIT